MLLLLTSYIIYELYDKIFLISSLYAYSIQSCICNAESAFYITYVCAFICLILLPVVKSRFLMNVFLIFAFHFEFFFFYLLPISTVRIFLSCFPFFLLLSVCICIFLCLHPFSAFIPSLSPSLLCVFFCLFLYHCLCLLPKTIWPGCWMPFSHSSGCPLSATVSVSLPLSSCLSLSLS